MLLRDAVAYAFLIAQVLRERITSSEFVFYFGLITGFSAWTVGLAEQINILHRFSLQCDEYRAFIEMPDHMRREGGIPLPKQDEGPCAVDFNQVSFS